MAGKIGGMRARVLIQKQAVSADDGGGGGPLAWSDIETVWAEITPLSVWSKIRAAEANLGVTHLVTMRWRSDLGTFDQNRYRLVYEGREMRINGVDEPKEFAMLKRFLELTCEMGQAVHS